MPWVKFTSPSFLSQVSHFLNRSHYLEGLNGYTEHYPLEVISIWVLLNFWVVKIFFVQSSVYFCHLFLISPASVRSTPFLSFIEPIFAGNIPLVSLIFLKRSQVFPILLFSSISLHWSLRKAFLSLLAFFGTLHSNGYIFPYLLCFWLLFFSQLFVRPPQTAMLLFCVSFPWGWSWSLSPVQCHEPHSIVNLDT